MPLLDSLLEDELLVSELQTPLKEIFLAIRTDSTRGDGTRENPFAAQTATLFDTILRDYRIDNVVFRLGPGLFRTAGGVFSGNTLPVILKSGQRIAGAGMFNTILRLTCVPPGNELMRGIITLGQDIDQQYNEIEISDLTIDCNLGDQPKLAAQAYPLMWQYAIFLNGRNNRIRRVRVINFGTRTPQYLNGVEQGANSHEAFILSNGGPESVIEDCIIEQPYLGTARETTICSTGGEASSLRNNFFDLSFVNPRNGFATKVLKVEVTVGSSFDTVTVYTQFPHNVWVKHFDAARGPDYIELKGSDVSAFNGRWEVTHHR
jgi:hypothetical protein